MPRKPKIESPLITKPMYENVYQHHAASSKSLSADKKRPTFSKEVALRTRLHQSPEMAHKIASIIILRRQFLQKQHVSNVQNELSRLQGIQQLHTSHTHVLPRKDIIFLNARAKYLTQDLEKQPIIGEHGQYKFV